jgi:uncharacterized protein with NRDE domain
MCLILLSYKTHADYPLVVAANRDEFFVRPTAPAAFWPAAQHVLAGRDLQAGGTWLGITRNGRFAALTNYRDPAQNAQRPSRGALVADFLTGTETPADYLARIAASGIEYNGYNLLLGDGDTLWWASNVTGEQHALAPGIYGLSNDVLDTPWPKVGAGKTALGRALNALPDDTPLFHLLRNDAVYPDEHLPATGVPPEWERLLSAAFVKSPAYGTRCSTVLYRRHDGWLVFDEQTWLAGAQPGGRVRYRWQVESAG